MKRIIAPILAAALIAGCATQKDVKEVETKVDVLSTKTTETKTVISSSLEDVLDKQETFAKWQKSAEERFQLFMRNQADLKADLDSMDRKMNTLSGGLEENAHYLKKVDERLQKLDERIRDMYVMFMDAGMGQQQKTEAMRSDMVDQLDLIAADVADIRAALVKKKRQPKKKAPPAKPKEEAAAAKPAAEAPKQSADELYNGGYTHFLKGEFSAAEADFAEYVKRYPKTDLADNAQYWVGEARANRGDAAGALAAFAELVRTFPRSTKAATALWRAAELAEKKGDVKKAREFLEKIVDNYPTSYEATMVDDKFKSLEGEGAEAPDESGTKE